MDPVRVIEVFVDALDLAEMSFEGVEPATGRPRPRPKADMGNYFISNLGVDCVGRFGGAYSSRKAPNHGYCPPAPSSARSSACFIGCGASRTGCRSNSNCAAL